ncbi:hypothetical protein [Streptomyces sp. NPDC012888]|uniref:hypothetical protein n=1 Tax=Streptomyces sp. NPDC012888 TaxID=3364855 RepID=UPI003698084D
MEPRGRLRARLRGTPARRALTWAGAALAVLLGLAVYVLVGSRLSEPELKGRWTSSAGGELVFGRDGDFTALNIGLAPACDAAAAVLSPERRISGTGRWALHGRNLEITFRPAGEGVRPCTLHAVRGRTGALALAHDTDAGTPEPYLRESRRDRRE